MTQETIQCATRNAEMRMTGLYKYYGYGPTRQAIIADCSFTLEAGKTTVLIGPSGCGKSVLINLLAGYERPDAGEITLGGCPVTEPGGDRLVVFQETALFPWMNSFNNVAYGPAVQRGEVKASIKSRVLEMLEKVGLTDFAGKYPSQLSGGMQRRGELARMLINDPLVMALDEPFRGLDAMTRELMQEYFVALLEERGGTVLFVTSEIDEAIFMADRLLIMSNKPGRIVREMEIPLPRPRTRDMLKSDVYLDCKREALAVLHAEAVKAFADGSRAMQDFLEAYRQEQQQEDEAAAGGD